VKESVIDDSIIYNPSAVRAAIEFKMPNKALHLYLQTQLFPQSLTAAEFRRNGYTVGSVLEPAYELFHVFRGSQPMVGKPLNSQELARAQNLFNGLDGKPIPHMPPFNAFSIRGKHFMVMPHYVVTVERMPPMNAEVADTLFDHIMSALDGLHALVLSHNDVKRTNVGISEAGDFFLIDLQSVVRHGKSTEATRGCVPADLVKQGLHLKGSIELDHWMLATLIWSSIGHPDTTNMHETGSRPPSMIDDETQKSFGGTGLARPQQDKPSASSSLVAEFPVKRSQLGLGAVWPTSTKVYADLQQDAAAGWISGSLWVKLSALLRMYLKARGKLREDVVSASKA
jgi:hypothetical protein